MWTKCSMPWWLSVLSWRTTFLLKNLGINHWKMSRERFLENKKIISIDVRPILAKGEDPFNSLQKALKKLEKEEVLEILIDFEPIPLIRIQERSEEHTSELQSRPHLVCRLLLEKKNKQNRFTCLCTHSNA